MGKQKDVWRGTIICICYMPASVSRIVPSRTIFSTYFCLLWWETRSYELWIHEKSDCSALGRMNVLYEFCTTWKSFGYYTIQWVWLGFVFHWQLLLLKRFEEELLSAELSARMWHFTEQPTEKRHILAPHLCIHSFISGFLQRCIHYVRITLDIALCLRCNPVVCRLCFDSWLHCGLHPVSFCYTDRYFNLDMWYLWVWGCQMQIPSSFKCHSWTRQFRSVSTSVCNKI
jgi:hypothetical protein